MFAANSVTIHCRLIKRRHINWSKNILRQATTICFSKHYLNRIQFLYSSLNFFYGLIDTNHADDFMNKSNCSNALRQTIQTKQPFFAF